MLSLIGLRPAAKLPLPSPNWYDGIESVKVFDPTDPVGSVAARLWESTVTAEFGSQRHALLLKRGVYGDTAQLPVGYYTGVYGVGRSAADVKIASFYTLDNPTVGNACNNFWRSVEGVTTTNPSITWAASQAAPLRRLHVHGELRLSEDGPPHWSSGGFLAESEVDGPLLMGTQQQYLVRNSRLHAGARGRSKNYVFVGVEGGPATSSTGEVTSVGSAPRVAAKPYLMEEGGRWVVVVPSIVHRASGLVPAASAVEIEMCDVYVARAGDTAATINDGMANKKALLLTPAMYPLRDTITIRRRGFVVLGIGFATLVPTAGRAALRVSAADVRVAGVLVEAGTDVDAAASEPMVEWDAPGGVASDLFTRVGAFSESPSSCRRTRADTHVRVIGEGVVLDNTWFWHADHDDCGRASDRSYSAHGLVVHGARVVAYGLKVEHTMANQVEWYGESGETYLFQSELPYHLPSFSGVGYFVSPAVKMHKAYGIGVYVVGDLVVQTGIRLPRNASATNLFAWVITGARKQVRSVVCTGANACFYGDRCDYSSCYQYRLPVQPQ